MSDVPKPELPVPAVGDWYSDAQGVTLEVVAVDERDRSIEVQYFDGTLEEFDLESWADLELKPAEAPEDWSGPLDMQREDYSVDREEERQESGTNPLDRLDL